MDSGSDTADEWVKSAMSDERLVAVLLLHMQASDSYHALSHPPRNKLPPTCWATHKPRTKQSVSEKKEKDQIRRSPTTPLSWSGVDVGSGASPSEGYEESSRPSSDRFVSGGVRCKGIPTNDDSATPPTPPSKRSRRKKTYAQLKEEENSLLKERTDLKKELASIRMTLKEQRSLNERLKRRKLELQVKPQVRFISASHKLDTRERTSLASEVAEASSSVEDPSPITPRKRMKQEATAAVATTVISLRHLSCPRVQQDVSSSPSSSAAAFVLPDLNAMPDEDSGGCVAS